MNIRKLLSILLCFPILFSCKQDETISVSFISLDTESRTLLVGQDFTLIATVSPRNADNVSVVWTSSNSMVASVTDGVVSALSKGETTITARSDDNSVVSASCKVTVSEESISLQGLQFVHNVTELELLESESDTLLLSYIPVNTTDHDVIWSSSNENVAVVNNGVVVALRAGKTDIFAQSKNNPDVFAACKVYVSCQPSGIVISNHSLVMEEGQSDTLTARIYPARSMESKVIWNVSKNNVIEVDAQGHVRALKSGRSTVYASTEDLRFTDSCSVLVTPKNIPVTGIDGITDTVLYVGEVYDFEVNVNPVNASNTEVRWQSSNENVVKVDNSGKATAIGHGEAMVWVSTVDQGFVQFCKITVFERIRSLSVGSYSESVYEGETFQFNASVEPVGSDQTLVWSSDDPSVVIVDNSGKVAALKPGKTTVVVTSRRSPEFKKELPITVLQYVEGISIEKLQEFDNYYVGDEPVNLKSAISPNTEYVLKGLKWSTSTPDLISVSETDGVLKALKPGTATVSVTTDAKMRDGKHAVGTLSFEVKQHVDSICLDKRTATVRFDGELDLTATVYPFNATDRKYMWHSSDTTVAIVTDGHVVAKSKGTTEITVKSNENNKSDKCVVTVFDDRKAAQEISFKEYSMVVTENDVINLRDSLVINPANADIDSIVWESKKPSIISIGRTDGVARANKSNENGVDIWVYVYSFDRTVKKDHISIRVKEPEKVKVDTLLYFTKHYLEIEELDLPFDMKSKLHVEPANIVVKWRSTNSGSFVIDANTGILSKIGHDSTRIIAQSGTHSDTITVSYPGSVTPPVTQDTVLSFKDTSIKLGIEDLGYDMNKKLNNPANLQVKWSSSNPNSFNVDINTGMITKIGEETTVITVTAGTKSAGITVIPVSSDTPDTPDDRTVSIHINETVSEMYVGQQLELTANVNPSENSSKARWLSTKPNVIEITSQDGASATVQAKSAGTCKIQVYAQDNESVCSDLEITVLDYVPVTDVVIEKVVVNDKGTMTTFTKKQLDNGSFKMYMDQTAQIFASVSPNNASNTGLVYEYNKSGSVIMIDKNGVIHPTGIGKAAAFVNSADEDYKVANSDKTFAVEVLKRPVESVTLDRTAVTLSPGGSLKLKATVLPSTATDKSLSWTSTKKNVATVDDDGNVKAVSKGETYIEAVSKDNDKIIAKCRITVSDGTVEPGKNENVDFDNWN